MWSVDAGLGEVCPPGTMIMIQRSPNRIELVRPMVGVVLTLALDGTQEDAAGDRLRITNVSEGVDVRLSRASAATYQGAAVAPAAVEAQAADDQRSNNPLRSFLRRFAIGAAIAAIAFYALVVVFTVASDLHGLGKALVTYALFLLLGFGLIGLPLGWFLRGAGILGGIVGVWLTGFFPSGDRVATAIDPLAGHLDRVDLNGVGAAAGLAIFGILGLGLVGWGVGKFVRSRSTPRTQVRA
jgi:hypothetical protein